jgi:hypothetical protein
MLLIAAATLLFSCIAPKKGEYPVRKPFVYKTLIRIDGKLTNDERLDMETRLQNQIDDSLHARTITAFGGGFPFIYRKLPHPPVYDVNNLVRSNSFMIALLNSMGYYSPQVKDSVKIDTVGDQYRATILFKVHLGKNIKIDSVAYDLRTPELEALALKSQKNSLLQKGKPFSKQLVYSELQRLILLFQNNGYYKFSIKDIYMERDTVLAALFDPSLDPFEQARLLEELKKKREDPTISLVVKQRPPQDSSELKKYYIDSIKVFPDTLTESFKIATGIPVYGDSNLLVKPDTVSRGKISVISTSNRFKPSIIFRNLLIKPGDIYNISSYNKAFERFSYQLGAWDKVTLDYVPSNRADTFLNAEIRMYPSLRGIFSGGLEASYNTNDILTTTNLFGFGANVSFRYKNAFHRAIQSVTTVRSGVEFGPDFIQTIEADLSHTFSIPHIDPQFVLKRYDDRKTLLNFTATYTDRREFFTLKSVEGTLGWQGVAHNHTITIRPLNIEYTTIAQTNDSLNDLIAQIPSLKLAFKTGLVIGEQFIYFYSKTKGIHENILRITAEESGGLYGFGSLKIFNRDSGELAHFVKADIEYRHHITYRNTELAFRAFAGYGLAYGNGIGTQQTLPFYKAFFAGGPNSMRGWQVRQVGLGSSYYYDTTTADKFGDIKIEGNIEYRFNLGTIYGIKIGSAIYTDAGNIWNRNIPKTDTTASLAGSDFALNRFYKEFAVDIGTGLRFDFSNYFIVRFDWAYIVRDPRNPDYPNRWFYDMQLKSGQFQLGIGYPF